MSIINYGLLTRDSSSPASAVIYDAYNSIIKKKTKQRKKKKNQTANLLCTWRWSSGQSVWLEN